MAKIMFQLKDYMDDALLDLDTFVQVLTNLTKSELLKSIKYKHALPEFKVKVRLVVDKADLPTVEQVEADLKKEAKGSDS